MPLLPGEILKKRYRIVNLLQAGRYGAVYRAWDLVDSQDVAVKEYLNPSPETEKYFRAEARQLARMHHEQLPELLDYFVLEESGQYMISTYIDGVDLQSLLGQYGPLPSDLIISWLQAVCKPLAYLHQNDRLHLNIKPANIRLTPAGELFLVDSGLPGLGLAGDDSGYTSPEQQAHAETKPVSDIYSLGATLYALLTDQAPPDALRRESGLIDLLAPRELNPDIEPYLSIVAMRAMSLRQDSRYETVEAFARALERPSGRPAPEISQPRRVNDHERAAPTPRVPAKARRKMEQRTIWAMLASALVVVALAIGFVTLNAGNSDGAEGEATATVESAVIAALTAIAPTPTPLPVPTVPPTPTPEPFVGETGVRMLFVPAGVFRMGDDQGESDEQPSHLIKLDAYFIDETEVTNSQYALCVADGGCLPPEQSGATYHPAYYGDPEFDDYPAIFITWYAADAYCQWREARLPTEAEWEKAAGFDPVQTIKLRYPWGDAFDGTQLNYCDSNCPLDKRDAGFDDGHRDTAAVGSYQEGRSPIGLFDMSGNVMEWVADWYDPRYYRSSVDINPRGPLEGSYKSLRGGSWLSARDELAVTVRSSFDPTVARANLGFRCAKDAQ